MGQYQIMDTTAAMTSVSLNMHQIAAAGPISAFDVSSTYQNIGVGDEAGCFHLYSNNRGDPSVPNTFNQFSQETQFADMVSLRVYTEVALKLVMGGAMYCSVPNCSVI